MKVLITGGAGFIGSNLCEKLVKEGYKVEVIDNLSVTLDNVNFLRKLGVKLHVANIGNFEDIMPFFENMDYVFHLAAMNRAQVSIQKPLVANKSNINGTINVLEAARQTDVKKLINISSSSVYARVPEGILLKEDMRLQPPHPYGVGKLAGEHYTRIYQQLYGLKTITLRYFSVYGPRQLGTLNHAAVIAKFIHKALNNQPVEIYGDGNQKRNFTYAEDVVNLTIKAGLSKASGDIFNVANPRETTVNQMIDFIEKILNKKIKRKYLPALQGDPKSNPADISKIIKVFNYMPKIDIEEGIRRTIQYHLSCS